MSIIDGKGKKYLTRWRVIRIPKRSCCMRAVLLGCCLIMIGTFFLLIQLVSWGRTTTGFPLLSFNSPTLFLKSFSVGDYLQYLKPANTSYCIFPFGQAENFTIPDELFLGSPELGDKGPYRVVYNVVLGKSVASEAAVKAVTFVTHSTLEYVLHIPEMARAWEGPVSVACYLPSWDFPRALAALRTLCICEPAMQNVSIHVVFHTEYSPNTTDVSSNDTVDSCRVPRSVLSNTERERLGLPYPVNVARNVARQGARTELLLVADIELFPSANLAAGFLDMLRRLPGRITGEHSFIKKRHVFVVPVFEVSVGVGHLPRTKKELLMLYSRDRAVYFHKFVCVHCQRFPGLQQWLQRRQRPRGRQQMVQTLLVVKREFPHHRWEPIYIGTNREPLYNELLIWEGQQDKMAQMYEMCLQDYRFAILDGVFLVHAPGIKVKKGQESEGTETKYQANTSVSSVSPSRRLQHTQRNSFLYRIITQDLLDKYGEKPGCRRF